jgi:hypothetical protein
MAQGVRTALPKSAGCNASLIVIVLAVDHTPVHHGLKGKAGGHWLRQKGNKNFISKIF